MPPGDPAPQYVDKIHISHDSGRQDLNLRLPGPKPGALARLSYAPFDAELYHESLPSPNPAAARRISTSTPHAPPCTMPPTLIRSSFMSCRPITRLLSWSLLYALTCTPLLAQESPPARGPRGGGGNTSEPTSHPAEPR